MDAFIYIEGFEALRFNLCIRFWYEKDVVTIIGKYIILIIAKFMRGSL